MRSGSARGGSRVWPRSVCAPRRSELHEHFPVVPEPIREFIDEVKQHLDVLTRYEGPDLALDEKINFLRETRHAFGRTALVLSGGGALGAFHVVRAPGPGGALRSEWSRAARFFAECTSHALAGCSRRSCAVRRALSRSTRRQGVVKALFEQNLLPRVLAGSSVGSIGAALALDSHRLVLFVWGRGSSSPLCAAA